MRSIVIGMGEVGTAFARVLERCGHDVETKDIEDKEIYPDFDLMSVAIQHNNNFIPIVQKYAREYKPKIINICSTVPPGTTELVSGTTGLPAVHSTTRGLHPNLYESMLTFTKHIGGPEAQRVADMLPGIKTQTHALAKTTELAHILHNAAYGVSLMFADEMNKVCRHYGVDYNEAVTAYVRTGNEGFRALDHASKCRTEVWPPGGRIGGHCVVHGAGLIPDEVKTPLLKKLAGYNEQ